MGGRHADDNRKTADLDRTGPVNGGGLQDLEAFPRFADNALPLLFREGDVGLILEVINRPALVVIANPALEGGEAARGRIENRLAERRVIKGCVLDPEGHDQSPLRLSTGDRGDEDDLVVRLNPGLPIAELAIAGAAEGINGEGQAVPEADLFVEAGGRAGQ